MEPAAIDSGFRRNDGWDVGITLDADLPTRPTRQTLSPRDRARQWQKIWRRGRDSNPREALTPTRFPVAPIRPLWHLSAGRPTATPAPSMRRRCRQGTYYSTMSADLPPLGRLLPGPKQFRVGMILIPAKPKSGARRNARQGCRWVVRFDQRVFGYIPDGAGGV